MARSIRDYTDSKKVNQLSTNAEVLFVRLLLKADDFGGFHGNTSLIKAYLFPLRLDSIREVDISRWMAECQKAGLIQLYEVATKPYVRIIDFRQKLKRMKAIFPPPQDNSVQHGTTKYNLVQPFPEEEDEEELETEVEIEVEDEMQNSEKKINEIVNSVIWIEGVSMKFKQGFDKTRDQLHEFLDELKLKEDLHKSAKEIKSHFINWLKIQIEKEKNSAKKENNGFNNRSEQDRRANERAKLREGFAKVFSNGPHNDTSPNSTIDGEATIVDGNS